MGEREGGEGSVREVSSTSFDSFERESGAHVLRRDDVVAVVAAETTAEERGRGRRCGCRVGRGRVGRGRKAVPHGEERVEAKSDVHDEL